MTERETSTGEKIVVLQADAVYEHVPFLLPVMAALDEIRAEVKRANAINEVLMGRLTDHSHLTLREIAQLQGISESAARRRYGAHLEVIPGTRKRGVPRRRVLDGWVPAKTVRTANARKKEIA